MRKEIQKIIDAYQDQVDMYEKQTQLPWFWNWGCCNETTITVAKQFIQNLTDILNSNK
jgi:lysozyme family protein